MTEHSSMAAVREFCAQHYVVAGTGTRQFEHNPETVTVLEDWIKVLKKKHSDLVLISGMAEGWDEQIARSAIALEIPFVALVPNSGYGAHYWGRKSQSGGDRSKKFSEYLACAHFVGYVCQGIYENGIHANFVRNTRMVELADEFLVLDPRSRGTKDCFAKIVATEKPYRIFGR
jgi:hypothetical protein